MENGDKGRDEKHWEMSPITTIGLTLPLEIQNLKQHYSSSVKLIRATSVDLRPAARETKKF